MHDDELDEYLETDDEVDEAISMGKGIRGKLAWILLIGMIVILGTVYVPKWLIEKRLSNLRRGKRNHG